MHYWKSSNAVWILDRCTALFSNLRNIHRASWHSPFLNALKYWHQKKWGMDKHWVDVLEITRTEDDVTSGEETGKWVLWVETVNNMLQEEFIFFPITHSLPNMAKLLYRTAPHIASQRLYYSPMLKIINNCGTISHIVVNWWTIIRNNNYIKHDQNIIKYLHMS